MSGDHTTIRNALEELRKGFFSGVPARLQKIEQTITEVLANNDLSERQDLIRSLVIAFHSLAGTSATYGYHDISKHAKAAERHLKEINPDIDNMTQAMTKLRAYQQAIGIDIEDEGSQRLSEQELKQLTTHLEANRSPDKFLIYLADEDEVFVEDLNTLLLSSGFKVQCYNNLYELEQRIRYQRPDILVIDSDFAGNDYSGFDFIAELDESLDTRLPTIFISDNCDNEHKYRASSIRNCFYLQKPINVTELLQSIELVISRTFTEPHRVLVVDDDIDHGKYVAHIMQQNGISVRIIDDAKKALNCIAEFSPEVILLDIYMPDYNGIELASMIRLDPKQQFTSILFLSIETDPNRQLEAIGLGGDDFLTKPVDPRLLVRTVEIRAQRARAFKKANFELNRTVNELEQFKIALDQHAIVSIADQDGKITYINPRFCEVSGYTPDELIGKDHNILNSGYHSRHFFSDMWQTISAGKTWQGQIKNRKKSGEEYWVESTITPFLNEAGKPYQYVSIRTDISRQKSIAEKLATSEERLRRSQSYANIGTWDWNIKTGELHWSERVGPLFGYDQMVDTTYQNFINAVHPEDRQYVMDAVNACIERGEVYDIEHRTLRSDGEIRWLSEKGDVVRDDNNLPVHMLGVVQDITLRKHAEQELQESQTKLKAMFELSPLGFALTDMQGHYVEFNEAFRQICGYPADELMQLDYWTLTPHEYEKQEAIQLETLHLTGRYGPYEKVYRQKNGNLIPIRLNGMLVKSQSGENQIWSIVENITDSKTSEQALISAKEEAESANRAKSEFLSRMSHELRTPMNAILGFAQLMESDSDDPLSDSHQSSIDQILKAGWHLLELINEVLDLSKIESGKLDISMETVEAGAVISECLQMVEGMAKQHDVSIEHNDDAKLYIFADRTRFKQVYLNLLTNAIKYNRRGGKVMLRSHVNKSGDGVEFRIEDTGNGIPEEQLPHLFEPFNRLGAEDSAIEGTGIGLVITRRLVELMDGDIGIESTEGLGTTFFFTLKAGKSTDNAIITVEHENRANEALSMNAGEFTVLYVEDNPANLKLVSQILKRIGGINYYTETSGLRGLATAQRIQPDLILLDINLPDMDGMEIAEALKSDEHTRQIPLIAISANAMPTDVSTAMSKGFVDYLTKPIDVTRFTRLISGLKQSDR